MKTEILTFFEPINKLSRMKGYKIVKFLVAFLTILFAVLALVGSWYLSNYSTAKEIDVDKHIFRIISFDKPLSDAALACGFIGLIAAVATLGTSKQPYNFFVLSFSVVMIVVLLALAVVCFSNSTYEYVK